MQKIIETYQKGLFEECLKLTLELLRKEPNNFEALSYKGACELKLDLFTEAVATFTQNLSLDEYKFHIWVFRGDAYYELGDYERAFSDYWHSLQLEPDNGAVMDKCARSLFRIGNRQYALEYITKAVEKSESVEPFIIMATMLDAMSEKEKAEEIRKDAISRFPEETPRIRNLK